MNGVVVVDEDGSRLCIAAANEEDDDEADADGGCTRVGWVRIRTLGDGTDGDDEDDALLNGMLRCCRS